MASRIDSRLLVGVCVFVVVVAGEASSGIRGTLPADETVWPRAAVAADHPLASQAGVEILEQGGNVVDAAVAVGFALSVLRPASSGLGGGGLMVIWDAQQQRSVALDYRERAPLGASRDMYRDTADDASRKGGLAVAVPGHVAGLCFALEKYGSLPLATVLQPAIRFARDGVPLDRHAIAQRRRLEKTLLPGARREFFSLGSLYGLSARSAADDRICSPQLKALETLAAQGRNAFYSGPIAEAIVRTVQQHGGILTRDDLRQMDVVERSPLTTEFDGATLITMPPPSSGGVAMIESLHLLNWVESHRLNRRIETLGHNSPEYLHLLAEVLKHAFADRAEFLGDADFGNVPVERLTSPAYAAKLAERILLHQTRPAADYGRFALIDDAGTTHFSVIDARGNAVACTETINTTFGSWLVEPEFGIVLNNEMDDFAARPGEPNAFGLLQSEANAVAPRKKPLSSMSPTIVVRDGRAVFAVGASGGPRIISSTLQVLLNHSRFGMSPHDAVTKPRLHHQWMPETLLLEPGLPQATQDTLARFGHKLEISSDLAISQAVARDDAGLRAMSDPRKNGRAAGR